MEIHTSCYDRSENPPSFYLKNRSPVVFPNMSLLVELFGLVSSEEGTKRFFLNLVKQSGNDNNNEVYRELMIHNVIGYYSFIQISLILNIRLNIFDIYTGYLYILRDDISYVKRQIDIVVSSDHLKDVSIYTSNYQILLNNVRKEISHLLDFNRVDKELIIKKSHNHAVGHVPDRLKYWLSIINAKMSNHDLLSQIDFLIENGFNISESLLQDAGIGFYEFRKDCSNRISYLTHSKPGRLINLKIVKDNYGWYEENRETAITYVDSFIDITDNYSSLESLLFILNSREYVNLDVSDEFVNLLESSSIEFISKSILLLLEISKTRNINVEIYQALTAVKSEITKRDVKLRASFNNSEPPVQLVFSHNKFFILRSRKTNPYTIQFPISSPIKNRDLKISAKLEPVHLIVKDQRPGDPVPFNSEIHNPIQNFSYLGVDKKSINCQFLIDEELILWPISKGASNIHDYTFKILVDDTDKSFQSLGLILEDGDDNKTPDYMYITTNKKGQQELIIIEFTTSQNPSIESLQKSFIGKKLKYSDMIKARCEKYGLQSKYFIICVSKNKIYSNMLMNTDIINTLVSRYRLALAMYNSAVEKEDMIKEENELSIAVKRIKGLFSSIKNDEFSNIDKDMYLSLSEEPNPNDYREVESIIKQSLDEVVDEQKEKMSKEEDIFDSINGVKLNTFKSNTEAFYEKMNILDTRCDNKAPVQIPLLYPNNQTTTYYNKDTLRDLPDSSVCPTYNLWCVASKGKIEMKEDLITEAERVFNSEKEQVIIEENQKKYRRLRNRYKYKIPSFMETDLAKIGINGKKHQNDPEVRLYRSEKKKPFNYFDTPISDIETFIQSINHTDFLSQSEFYDNRQESVISLLKEALRLHNTSDSSKFSRIILQYSNSKIGGYLRLVSDLAFELSSSLKQNMDSNSVIIKKLKYFPIYVMIKTTRMNSKLFYSLLWDSRSMEEPTDHGKVFKSINKVAHIRYTDFVSTDIAKLTNLCRAESMGLSILMFWLEQFSVTIDVSKTIDLIELCGKDDRVFRMFKFCMLVLFNDKHYCEELITLSRFIHMESLVVFPNYPNPSKMLEKIEPIFRSRLEVWIARKLIALITEYTIKESTHLKSMDENYRAWEGFLNPFLQDGDSLGKFHNQDEMLSSCYLGYLKNKDETSEINASGKLLNKILGMENQLPDNDVFLGRKNPEFSNIKKHEFNLSMVKVMSDNFLRMLKKEKGFNSLISVKEYLANKIMEKLNHQDLETFASLKATSNFSSDFYIFDKDKPYHRSKVIEKVILKLKKKMESDSEVLVVDLMREALEILELDSSLHICIFKKNQHGGLREIYVLDLNGRIVQKIIEDFARSILSEIESETMTHPNNKFRIPEEHNRSSKKYFKNQYLTLTTSDDAAKWNQGHYVTKFMCMFYQLLPSYLHGFITRCLQLWLNKKIKISDDLLSLFDSLTEINTKDSVVKEIFEVYKGKVTSKWMKPNSSYIQTKSGMMQGILHYTSSLFHSLFLLHLKELSLKLLKQELPSSSKSNNNAIIDHMQSSDDSSFIISIWKYSEPTELFASLLSVQKCFRLKDILGNQIGIYRSIKSTTMTLFINEFNSEFFFLGDVHRPTFRWVNASISMTEQETLMARQEESYNLLTNVIQGGGTILLSHIIQWCQGLLHYRLLGSSLSDLWPLYSNMIINMKDPALGFFLMDHPMLAGLPGLNYNLWLTCRTTLLGYKYHDMFTESLNAADKSIKEITAETASIGLFSRSTTVSWHSSKKWRELTKQLEMDDDWVSQIDNDPSILYFRPKTVKELKLKLGIKLKSPGVISSLGKSNAIPRVIASGVYILSRPILHTQASYYLNEIGNSNKITLTTELLRSIDRYITNSINQDNIHLDVTNRTRKIKSIQNDFKEYKYNCLLDLLSILSNKFLTVKNLGDTVLNAICQKYRNKKIKKVTEDIILDISKYANISVILISNHGLEEVPIYYHYSGSYDTINTICLTEDSMTFGYTPLKSGDLARSENYSKLTIQEEKILFPHLNDYENIKSIADGLNTNISKPTKNNRRRQRSNIIITGSHYTDGLKIKMEDILVWKWFNIDRLRISRDALQVLFDKYKNWIPWLNEDIQTTLSQSPFQNHIQLQNFISRQDLSPRIVHLVGSYGKNRYGNISLPNVIKNNFSNSITFPEILDINSRLKYEHSNDILHILTCLSQSALTQKNKNIFAYDLLLHSKQIVENLIPGSLINKLQIIQEFALNCPEMILENDLTPSEIKEVISELPVNLKLMKSESDLTIKVETLIDEIENSGKDFVEYVLEETIDWPEEEIEQLQEYYDNNEINYDQYVKKFKENIKTTDSDFSDIIRYNGKSGLKLLKDKNLTIKNLEEMSESFSKNIYSIFSKIREMRLGITGYYSIMQKYDVDRKQYIGKGQWIGRFENVDIEINIDTIQGKTILDSIQINTARSFDTTIKYVKTWCKENNVLNDVYAGSHLSSKNLLTKIINFEEVRTNGCPVFIKETLQTIMEQRFVAFKIDLSSRSLRLLGFYDNPNLFNAKYSTLIYIPLNAHHINEHFHIRGEFSRLESWPSHLIDWILWKPISKVGVEDLMSNYYNRTLIDLQDCSTWIQNLRESHLRRILTLKPVFEKNINSDNSDLPDEELQRILDKYDKMYENIHIRLNESSILKLQNLHGDVETILTTLQYYEEKDEYLNIITETHPYFRGFSKEFPLMNQWISGTNNFTEVSILYKNICSFLEMLTGKKLILKTETEYSKPMRTVKKYL